MSSTSVRCQTRYPAGSNEANAPMPVCPSARFGCATVCGFMIDSNLSPCSFIAVRRTGIYRCRIRDASIWRALLYYCVCCHLLPAHPILVNPSHADHAWLLHGSTCGVSAAAAGTQTRPCRARERERAADSCFTSRHPTCMSPEQIALCVRASMCVCVSFEVEDAADAARAWPGAASAPAQPPAHLLVTIPVSHCTRSLRLRRWA